MNDTGWCPSIAAAFVLFGSFCQTTTTIWLPITQFALDDRSTRHSTLCNNDKSIHIKIRSAPCTWRKDRPHTCLSYVEYHPHNTKQYVYLLSSFHANRTTCDDRRHIAVQTSRRHSTWRGSIEHSIPKGFTISHTVFTHTFTCCLGTTQHIAIFVFCIA